MKSKLFLFLCLSIIVSVHAFDVKLSSKAAILMNADNGAIIFEKDADIQHYPASITKIATALYALKNHEIDGQKTISATQDVIGAISSEEKRKSNYSKPAHWLEFGGTHIGIKKGEELSLETLFYGMMIGSGNDAANMIAHYVSGDVTKFVEDMNVYITELGCTKTKFYNPHGLFYPGHITTAYDMALITREALKNDFFRKVVSSKRYRRPQTNLQHPSWIINLNKLISKGEYYYPYAIGVKTGYCSEAQNTLVAAAKKGDRMLVAVLLNCNSRADIFRDAHILFETAYKEDVIQKTLFTKGVKGYTLDLKDADKTLKVYLKEDITLSYYPSEQGDYSAVIEWKELHLPISKDSEVGFIKIIDKVSSNVISSRPIFAYNDVKESWLCSLKRFFRI